MAKEVNQELQEYKKGLKEKLAKLNPLFAKASIGDFSKDVEIPEEENELTEFLVGIQIMIEVIREKTSELETLNRQLEAKVEKRTKELAQSEERLRNIVEYSTNLFYSHDVNHVLTYVSPQAKNILGEYPEEAKKRWTEFATNNPLNKKGFEATELAIKTGKPQAPYELELKKANGDLIWVLVNEAPIVKNGKTVAIVGALTDITQAKEAQNILLKQKEQVERMNKLMVGRELKMVELKQEIKRLKQRLDEQG